MEQEIFLIFLGMYGIMALALYKLYSIDNKLEKVTKQIKYEPTITLWKFFKQIVYGGASFIAVEVVGNYSTSIQDLQAPLIVILIALFNMVANYLKHR